MNRTLRSVAPLPVKKATVEERRVEILEMTRQVLIERGFANTRISDVAKGLGVSTSLIHYHFDSKEQLLAEAFSFAASQDLAEMVAEIEAVPTAVGQLDALIGNYVPEGSDDVEWMLWIDAWGEALRNPLLRAISQELDEQSIDLIEKVLRSGVATGEFTCPDPQGAAMRLAGLIDGLGVQFAAHTGVLDRERLLHHVRSVAAAEVGLSLADFGEAAVSSGTGPTISDTPTDVEVQVRRLLDAFGDALTRRDVDAAATLWSDDAVLETPHGTARGRDRIRTALAALVDPTAWIVASAPQAVVTADGPGQAHGRVLLDQRTGDADGGVSTLLATCHDTYVHTPAGWRFASRRLDVIHGG